MNELSNAWISNEQVMKMWTDKTLHFTPVWQHSTPILHITHKSHGTNLTFISDTTMLRILFNLMKPQQVTTQWCISASSNQKVKITATYSARNATRAPNNI